MGRARGQAATLELGIPRSHSMLNVRPRRLRQRCYGGPVSADDTLAALLEGLRHRADEDFLQPPTERVAGRHQLDLPDLGLRVSLTRSRYPNRPDGVDAYALTLTRIALDHAPAAPEVETVMATCFGAAAESAEERPGGPLVRLFRIPAA